MKKGESVTAYFMRIIELRDQLSNIGYEIESKELSLIALGGAYPTHGIILNKA